MQECTAQLCQDAGNTDFSIMTPIILESAPREPPAPHQGAALPLKECHSSHKQLLWHRNMFVSQQVTKALSQSHTRLPAHVWAHEGGHPEAAGRPQSHQGCVKISLSSMTNKH